MDNSIFTKYNGRDTDYLVPAEQMGEPVTEIAPKAFLSCRSIVNLSVASSVLRVGDWAFSHMKALKRIIFPAREIEFGKQVFLGCDLLEKIEIEDTEIYEGIPFFLADYYAGMDAQGKFSKQLGADIRLLMQVKSRTVDGPEGTDEPEQIGVSEMLCNKQKLSEQEIEFLAQYDRRLLAYLEAPDDTQYVPSFIGWFDVQDLDDQKAIFEAAIREKKIKFAVTRLKYSAMLSDGHKEKLFDYLRNAPVLELWQVSNSSLRNLDFLKAYDKAGGFGVHFPKDFLEVLDKERYPQEAAYLLECQMKQSGEKTEELFHGFLL